jgi:hypothetical protein
LWLQRAVWGTYDSGTLSNNNWGYLLEWEIPCILHVISPKIGMAFFETHIDFLGKKIFGVILALFQA